MQNATTCLTKVYVGTSAANARQNPNIGFYTNAV